MKRGELFIFQRVVLLLQELFPTTYYSSLTWTQPWVNTLWPCGWEIHRPSPESDLTTAGISRVYRGLAQGILLGRASPWPCTRFSNGFRAGFTPGTEVVPWGWGSSSPHQRNEQVLRVEQLPDEHVEGCYCSFACHVDGPCAAPQDRGEDCMACDSYRFAP